MKKNKVLLKTTRKFLFLSNKQVSDFLTQCAKIAGYPPENTIIKKTFKQECYDLLVQILFSFETKFSSATGKVKVSKLTANRWKIIWNKIYEANIEFDFNNNQIKANCSSYDDELKKVFAYDADYENFYQIF